MNSTNVTNTQNVAHVNPMEVGNKEYQGEDAIELINDLMINMGHLFNKMRDTLRQYQQAQMSNSFEMQKTSYNTRIEAIETDFEAKNITSATQIFGGVVKTVGGGISVKGGEAFNTAANGIDAASQGIIGTSLVNGKTRESQEMQALSEYQQGLAERQLKGADESLDKAIKTSNDLREMLSNLNQAYEKISSSVKIS